MAIELLVLRLLHIGLGAFWVGAVLFNTIFVTPALRAAGPAAAGAVMQHMIGRRLMVVMPLIAILTLLSGLRLMMIVSGGDGAWFRHRPGHTYSLSGTFAILAFVIGLTVVKPAMTKLGQLGREAAAGIGSKETLAADMAKLQGRAMRANQAVATLLVLAVVGMAVARYL